MSEQYRKTYMEVYLDKIQQNYRTIKACAPGKEVIPVVKADAYGMGAKQVVSYLIGEGHDLFAVATLEEALEIRLLNDTVDVFVMGLINSSDLHTASKKNIVFTVPNEDLYHAVASFDGPLRFHLKIDTGMNRLGFKDYHRAYELMNDLSKRPHLRLEGLFTHLATSDSDESFAQIQIRRFRDFVLKAPFIPPMVHVSNSSAAIKFEKDLDYTTHSRVGISLFGETLEKNLDILDPVFKVKSHIIDIKELKKGDMVGYDLTYEAQEDERIAILPIGYADGVTRKNQGGHVSLNGLKYPIVGRVCMDQMFIKVDETVRKNDIVVLVGDALTPVNEMANRQETIPHEILCQFSKRVPRLYMTNRK